MSQLGELGTRAEIELAGSLSRTRRPAGRPEAPAAGKGRIPESSGSGAGWRHDTRPSVRLTAAMSPPMKSARVASPGKSWMCPGACASGKLRRTLPVRGIQHEDRRALLLRLVRVRRVCDRQVDDARRRRQWPAPPRPSRSATARGRWQVDRDRHDQPGRHFVLTGRLGHRAGSDANPQLGDRLEVGHEIAEPPRPTLLAGAEVDRRETNRPLHERQESPASAMSGRSSGRHRHPPALAPGANVQRDQRRRRLVRPRASSRRARAFARARTARP